LSATFYEFAGLAIGLPLCNKLHGDLLPVIAKTRAEYLQLSRTDFTKNQVIKRMIFASSGGRIWLLPMAWSSSTRRRKTLVNVILRDVRGSQV
jgi:hypothetical protein